ncbi:MAG: hypothetical protein AB1521_07595 [Bacteroidota bacterium]
MNFIRVWFLGLINPSKAFEILKSKPAPMWGFWAVLIHFVVTSLTSILASHLLGRLPFESSYLTFLSMENYYLIEIFFLPAFGFTVWLLGSAIVHITLRLTKKASDFDLILNIIGFGFLIPMPVIWLWDWTMIALNSCELTVMAVSHSSFAFWEAILFSVGFKKILGLRLLLAVSLAIITMTVYVLLAIIFVR